MATVSCMGANQFVSNVLNTLGGAMCQGTTPDPTNPVCSALAASDGDFVKAAQNISKISRPQMAAYFKTNPAGAKALAALSPTADALSCIFTGGTNHLTHAERQGLIRLKEWFLMTLPKALSADGITTVPTGLKRLRMKVGTDLMLGESKDALLLCGGVVLVTVLITALLAHQAWKKRSF